MKIGDLVARTYGEGRRPMGIIVGWYNTSMVRIIWNGSVKIEEFGLKYLEIVNASR